jgi:hypothetical protein
MVWGGKNCQRHQMQQIAVERSGRRQVDQHEHAVESNTRTKA